MADGQMETLKVGERVLWPSDQGNEYGYVRWIGTLPDEPSGETIVGVEFDKPVGTGTGKYKHQRLFTAKQGHASLIPLMGLIRVGSDPPPAYSDQTRPSAPSEDKVPPPPYTASTEGVVVSMDNAGPDPKHIVDTQPGSGLDHQQQQQQPLTGTNMAPSQSGCCQVLDNSCNVCTLCCVCSLHFCDEI